MKLTTSRKPLAMLLLSTPLLPNPSTPLLPNPSSVNLDDFRRWRDSWNLRDAVAQQVPARPSMARGAAVGGPGLRPAASATNRRGRAPRMGFFDFLNQPDDEALSPEAAFAIESLCRPLGWDVKCEIGSEVARSVGGSGTLAKGSSSTALLTLKLGFTVDEGYAPPQGAVAFLAPSRFFTDASPRGFWKVDDDGDDGFPRQVQWRLHTSDAEEGLVLGGDTLLPAGAVYFNAKCKTKTSQAGEAMGITLGDGRITVKEDLGANTPLFQGRGILAEFKVCGTFECREALE